MSEPIEDLYFNWLYSKVAYRKQSTPSTRYYSLLYYLHRTPFAWTLSGDDNRAIEGRDLREQFNLTTGLYLDDSDMDLACSVLEMLIAFANRAAFQTELSQQEWFWIMIENLGFSELSDSGYSEEEKAEVIGPTLYDLVWRLYDHLGRGGLFPLHYSERDQTKLEIWEQFCEYLVDQNIS